LNVRPEARGALLAIALIAWTTMLAGCSATQKPPDDSDLRLQAASHQFGGRYEYLIIHSAGELGDSLFTGLARITGPSEMARDLATRLTAAEKGQLRILVSGMDAKKTLDVIRDAFTFHGKNRLPGLEFLFLGEPADEAEVRRLVEGVGGRMRFAAF
jgi:hypothetical protein